MNLRGNERDFILVNIRNTANKTEPIEREKKPKSKAKSFD